MKYLLFFSFVISNILSYSHNDTTWYSNDWIETTHANASYFRPKPAKIDNKYYVIDYYCDGSKQAEGFSLSDTVDIWDGEIKYYFTKYVYEEITTEGKIIPFLTIKDTSTRFSMKAITNYKNGVVHGVAKEYALNGKMTKEILFDNGKITSDTLIEYYDDGVKKLVIPYKNGKKNGKITSFYEDGAIQETYEALNDTFQGYAYAYYNDGSIRQKLNFKDGMKDGLIWCYHPNGKLDLEGQFKNDKQVGIWKRYDNTGSLILMTDEDKEIDDAENPNEPTYVQQQKERSRLLDGLKIDKHIINKSIIKYISSVSYKKLRFKGVVANKLIITVFVSKDSTYLENQYRLYKPATNEVVVFYDSDVKDYSIFGIQLWIKAGFEVRTGLKYDLINSMVLTYVVKESMFANADRFPGFELAYELRQEFIK